MHDSGRGRVLTLPCPSHDCTPQVLGFVTAEAKAAASIGLWESQAVLLLWLSILVLIPFDLVILDLIIPGESGGIDVINQIRGVDREVTAIVCSGYCSEPAMAKYTDYGFDYPLPKPFRVKDLVELIESLQITVR